MRFGVRQATTAASTCARRRLADAMPGEGSGEATRKSQEGSGEAMHPLLGGGRELLTSGDGRTTYHI